jgi:hypothetical protein
MFDQLVGEMMIHVARLIHEGVSANPVPDLMEVALPDWGSQGAEWTAILLVSPSRLRPNRRSGENGDISTTCSGTLEVKMKEESNTAFEAAEACSDLAKRSREGSETEEAAEHAIVLALSEHREESGPLRLFADSLRNARFSVRRSRARRLRAVEECGQLAERGVATGLSPGFVDYETPEDRAVAREMIGCLHTEACRCGAHGRRVLAGLLGGETRGEIAASAGISPATVDRTIRKLKDSATDYQSAA